MEWNRLKHEIEDELTPAEDRVAVKLRTQFSGTKSATALASEFKRYSYIMKREGLKRKLRSEREAFLSAFNDLIGKEERYLVSNVAHELNRVFPSADLCLSESDGKDLIDNSSTLRDIQTAKMAESKMENLRKLAREILSDLPAYEQISAKLCDILDDTRKRRELLIQAWVTNHFHRIKDSALSKAFDYIRWILFARSTTSTPPRTS